MIPVNIAVRDKTVFFCRLDTLCLLRRHFCEVGAHAFTNFLMNS